MNYFEFNSPTKIYFGKDVELKVGEVIKEKGYRVYIKQDVLFVIYSI